MRVLNTEQMREADRRTIVDVGVPSIDLMEQAGHEVVEALDATFDDLKERRIVVVCGHGNNGGDGFVAARALSQRGVDIDVLLLGTIDEVRGDARTNLEVLRKMELSIAEVPDLPRWEKYSSVVAQSDLIIDAILGTGLSRPLTGIFQRVVTDINALLIPVVSIDLPTGLSADDSRRLGETIQAAMTVTLGAPKVSLVMPPTDRCAGDLVMADIGIPKEIIDGVDGERLELITAEAVRSLISTRRVEAHKGDFGHVLIVAGSMGMSGAACLAGQGALRSGAGLVTVATPRSCLSIVAAAAPEYKTLPLPETSDGSIGAEALDVLLNVRCDVIAAGPGLGTNSAVSEVIRGLLEGTEVPLVLDADALNVIAADREGLRAKGSGTLVITPHPGEMARLCATTSLDVQIDRVSVARRYAVDNQTYVVLKGAGTLIAEPNGNVWVNPTGNPGMATSGAGDVLTGVTAAWLAQQDEAVEACQIAVYLHGLAGDLGAEAHGEIALTASDLVDALGRAAEETSYQDS